MRKSRRKRGMPPRVRTRETAQAMPREIVPEEDRIRVIMEPLSRDRQGEIAVEYTRHLELNDAGSLGMSEAQRVAMIAELEPYLPQDVKDLIAWHAAGHPPEQ